MSEKQMAKMDEEVIGMVNKDLNASGKAECDRSSVKKNAKQTTSVFVAGESCGILALGVAAMLATHFGLMPISIGVAMICAVWAGVRIGRSHR